ncbi:MAG: PD-(D/E)XK nuclease family transposase [Muribaculaceae bacterium]|nr:PD-(D/E)XK nuclease family transposase [Muribaculaceae bacterium]
MAKFIDPFTDTGFKIIFGKEHVSNEILVAFLNALFANDPVLSNIKSVHYRPSERVREWDDGKSIIYDIHCETSTGHRFILEMQLNEQEFFLKRAFYYCCRSIAEQGYKGKLNSEEREKKGVVKGDDLLNKTPDEETEVLNDISHREFKEYWDYDIVPVIGVFFSNFFIEGLPKKLVTFSKFLDAETHEPVGDYMQSVFIQIPAFTKSEAECITSFDQWMYNLKHMSTMESMAFTSHQDIFNRLATVANIATLSPAERIQYDYDLKKARDYYAELKFAIKKGIKQGIEQGIEQGREQGIEQGREQGIEQGREQGRDEELKANVNNMRANGLDDEYIAHLLNKPLTTISAIRPL